MTERIIKKKQNQEIYLNYDANMFKVLHNEESNTLILMYGDNYHLFSLDIGFLVQKEVDGEIHFVVSELICYDNVVLRDYKFDSINGLKLYREFACPSMCYEGVALTENTFLVETNGYRGKLYNLKDTTDEFSRIYNDKKINDFFGEKILMVSKEYHPFSSYQIKDTITYGIDPDTFRIKTPIWSELQQRFIPLYTMDFIRDKYPFIINRSYFDTEEELLESVTIEYEVEKYLNKLADYFTQETFIYDNSLEYKLNKDFLQLFLKK